MGCSGAAAAGCANPKAQALLSALITGPGPDAGVFLTNLPARGWCGYDALKAQRADLIMVLIQGNYDGTTAVDTARFGIMPGELRLPTIKTVCLPIAATCSGWMG